MKLNYSKKEIEERLAHRSLWATPLLFRDGCFTFRAYLTNLHNGKIRINIGKDDYFVHEDIQYKDLRRVINFIYDHSRI